MSLIALTLAALATQSAPHASGHAGHAPAPAAAAASLSVESSKIADLLANPAAKAIVEKHLPGFSSHPQIGMAGQMTLKGVQRFARDRITDAALASIQKDFAALAAK